MSASPSAADRTHVAPEGGKRALALEVLLRDLVRCLGSGEPLLHVAVGQTASADLVVRPAEAGFELLLGRLCDASGDRNLLARVAGELEVLEYCGAFAALYLDENEGDSPAIFVQRVGARYVRERIHRDPAGRAHLFRRTWQAARRRGTRCITPC